MPINKIKFPDGATEAINDSRITFPDIKLWSSKLSDAPHDGKKYARKNGAWSEVIEGGGGGPSSDHSVLANLDYSNSGHTGFQEAISDLDMIRSNASAGKSASDTISGYGNIVSHNASDFATAAALAAEATAREQKDSEIDESLANKANKDGYYEQMGVGVADNLTGKGDGVSAEFTRRTSGGTADIADGVATLKAIKGNTLVWNQLTKKLYNDSVVGVTAQWSEDGKYVHFSGTRTPGGDSNLYALIDISSTNKNGYKYLFWCDGSDKVNWNIYGNVVSGSFAKKAIATASLSSGADRISALVSLGAMQAGETIDENIHFNVFDLTQMFGAGNEPATVEEFEALFPNDYYAYNEGQLLSFKGNGIVTDGFNQFDGTKAKVFGGKAYYINGTYSTLKFAKTIDGTQTDITPSANLYTPTEDGYIFATGVSDDFCINLSWSGVRNGEYEPYWKETRNIPVTSIKGKVNGQGESVVIFPDGMRSAGTAHDEIVGNKAIKRIGVVDLGSLDWELIDGWASSSFRTMGITDAKQMVDWPYIPNQINNKGYKSSGAASATWDDKSIVINSLAHYINTTAIRDTDYTDASAFKTAMSGVLLYYELAEPVEYIIDEADVPNYNYKVSDFGTETLLPEGVDASGVPQTAPMIAQIVYGMNAVDFIRNAPKNYISKESMDSILSAMVSAGVIASYTLTWDATSGKYNCSITKPTE